MKTRANYIEPDYIDGIYDEDGNCVIRPLTEKEKQWLNKFYSEYIITSFKNTKSDFHNTQEKRRELYRENNRRHYDIFNVKQCIGELDPLDEERYDSFIMNNTENIDHEDILIDEVQKRLDFYKESENIEDEEDKKKLLLKKLKNNRQ